MKPSKKNIIGMGDPLWSPTRAGTEPRPYKVTILLAALVFMCGIFVSCGSEGEESPLDPSVAPLPQNDMPVAEGEWHNLLNSKHYSGYISVMFKDGTDIRLQKAAIKGPSKSFKSITREWPIEFVSHSNADVTKLNEVIATKMNVAVERGLRQLSEEDIIIARENAETAGVHLDDWNLYYTIAAPEPSEAEALIEEMKNDPNVRFIHPNPLAEPADNGITTADISGEQDYLMPDETHGGLNVIAGWSAGATGKGVVVVDEEINWNYNHEDLPINDTDRIYLDEQMPSNYTDAKFIQHGTAVIGILAGKNNNGGIKGIVHNATIKMFQTSWTTGDPFGYLLGGLLSYWTDPDGNKDKLRPGDVILIEVQSPGPTTTSGCEVGDLPGEEGSGCVPEEAYSTPFLAFKSAVDSGFVVVEAAGNGSLDLSSPEAHLPSGPDLATESTGAIMVGASLGSDHSKAQWTNCGTRVDVYGWGVGVVTTGYGDHPQSTPGDPNKWYTKSFNGTSSATAMVGGAIAQIQSYIKKVYADAGLINTDAVYFTALQMKQILQATGVPAVGENGCNIGIQPDVGAAIEYMDNGNIEPTINYQPVDETVVSGIRYDMDGDKKAELISFSRDGKWYIDLSTVGPNADHFGEWDLVMPSPLGGEGQGEGEMLFPVVHDYNSDGRADLALYDSVNGKYYIKYTTSTLILSLSKDEPIVWDRIIDYFADPAWKAYSRPIIGDINADRWLDISFQTPDGHWFIDYGGFDGVKLVNGVVQFIDNFGTIEEDFKYLSDDKLLEAPGWAWPTLMGGYTAKLLAKAPDGVPSSNKFVSSGIQADETLKTSVYAKDFGSFGGNDSYYVFGGYQSSDGLVNIGFKDINGVWNYINSSGWMTSPFISPEPQGYGDILCRPIPADYDGDGKDDRAVQCGTSWKLAYSTVPGTFRELDEPPVLVGDDEINAIDPLPAYVYPGGIKYQDQIDLFNYYKTKLPCEGGQLCTADDTIFDVQPPIGPYFAECVKYWAPNASYCWNK